METLLCNYKTLDCQEKCDKWVKENFKIPNKGFFKLKIGNNEILPMRINEFIISIGRLRRPNAGIICEFIFDNYSINIIADSKYFSILTTKYNQCIEFDKIIFDHPQTKKGRSRFAEMDNEIQEKFTNFICESLNDRSIKLYLFSGEIANVKLDILFNKFDNKRTYGLLDEISKLSMFSEYSVKSVNHNISPFKNTSSQIYYTIKLIMVNYIPSVIYNLENISKILKQQLKYRAINLDYILYPENYNIHFKINTNKQKFMVIISLILSQYLLEDFYSYVGAGCGQSPRDLTCKSFGEKQRK